MRIQQYGVWCVNQQKWVMEKGKPRLQDTRERAENDADLMRDYSRAGEEAYEVRPYVYIEWPLVEVCHECHGNPCDCNETIWNYSIGETPNALGWGLTHSRTRKDAIESRAKYEAEYPDRKRGQVQRVTDIIQKKPMTPYEAFKSGGPPRLVVQSFANIMECKLKENDHKGGWSNLHVIQLLSRLQDEIQELKHAVMDNKHPYSIAREAADVANFAMMIADNSGGLPDQECTHHG